MRCPRGQKIRKAYTYVNRKTGARTTVRRACIKIVGRGGASGVKIPLGRGGLAAYGYKIISVGSLVPRFQRQRALRTAIREGRDPIDIIKRLNVLRIYRKNQLNNPKIRVTYNALGEDMAYVRKYASRGRPL
jgi:hypothetical protein